MQSCPVENGECRQVALLSQSWGMEKDIAPMVWETWQREEEQQHCQWTCSSAGQLTAVQSIFLCLAAVAILYSWKLLHLIHPNHSSHRQKELHSHSSQNPGNSVRDCFQGAETSPSVQQQLL